MKDQLLGEGRYADLQNQWQFDDSVIIQCTLVGLRAWDKVYVIHKEVPKRLLLIPFID